MVEKLTSLTKPPITRELLREYAEASGDHNAIHLDDNFAKEAGFPSVIVHGMLSMAFLGDFVACHFPQPKYRVRKMHARFRKVTFPGDIITCEGEIKSRLDSTLNLAIRTRNQKGEVTTEATAEVIG